MSAFGDPALPARFWDKVQPEPNTGCWLWVGSTSSVGYGDFWLNGQHLGAHRLSYTSLVGPIPSGMVIDHLCRTTVCINPSHLEPVYQKENCRRGIKGVLTTHCPQGHPYNDLNTCLRSRGSRDCRVCRRAGLARLRARKRAEQK